VAARLRPRLDVAVDLLGRISRAGVVQKVPEEVPAVGVRDAFGQLRESKEEVPGPAELVRVVQSLRQLPGWAALRMASRSTTSGWFIAVAQATVPP